MSHVNHNAPPPYALIVRTRIHAIEQALERLDRQIAALQLQIAALT